jgi:hypothetical protein
MQVRPAILLLAVVLAVPGVASAQDKPTPPAAKPPAAPAAKPTGAPAASVPAKPTSAPAASVPVKPSATGAAATAAAPSASAPKPAGKARESLLPPPPARLWIIAPSVVTPWTLRIDNEGDKPLRIPADVRLLRFEIENVEVLSTKPGQPARIRTKKVKCAVPRALRPQSFPEPRALMLQPGQSYIEEFDPRLVCFGKDAAALSGGAVVRARFGWDPQPKGRAPTAPLAVEVAEQPPRFSNLRELTAPTMVIPYVAPKLDPNRPIAAGPTSPAPPPQEAAEKKPEKPDDAGSKRRGGKRADRGERPGNTEPAATSAEPVKLAAPVKPETTTSAAPEDINAPRLEIISTPYADVASSRGLSVAVTATNVGHRPTMAALRARMVAFEVNGPDKVVSCDASSATHSVPREAFRNLKPRDKVTFTVLLAEVCPRQTFSRTGMYRVRATLHANEGGSQFGLTAYTGVSPAATPTLVRLHTAPEPFYKDPPQPVPTPKPE